MSAPRSRKPPANGVYGLKQAKQEEFLKKLRTGVTSRAAALAVGISEATPRFWCRTDAAFAARMREITGKRVADKLASTARALASRLQRRDKERPGTLPGPDECEAALRLWAFPPETRAVYFQHPRIRTWILECSGIAALGEDFCGMALVRGDFDPASAERLSKSHPPRPARRQRRRSSPADLRRKFVKSLSDEQLMHLLAASDPRYRNID